MLKQLLSGTAVAALLVAGPAFAQTDTAPMEEETQMESQDSGSMDSGAQGDIGADAEADAELESDTTAQDLDVETDTDTSAQGDIGTDTGSESTAQDLEVETETDTTAQDMDVETDSDLAAEGEEELETEMTADAGSGETFFTEQTENEVLASELMGAPVENPEGEDLGDITDVLITEDTGVKAVVVGIGGFLGLGQKNVAVNFDEIEQIRGENGDVTLVFSATREELETAAEFRNLDQQMAEAEQQDMQAQQPPAGGGGMTTTPAAPPAPAE